MSTSVPLPSPEILSDDILRPLLLAAAGGFVDANDQHVLPFPVADPEAVACLLATCKSWASILTESRLSITFSLPSARRYPVAHYLDQLLNGVLAKRPRYLVHDIAIAASDFSAEELHQVLSAFISDPRLHLTRVDLSGYRPSALSALRAAQPLLHSVHLQRLTASVCLAEPVALDVLLAMQDQVDEVGIVIAAPSGGTRGIEATQHALHQVCHGIWWVFLLLLCTCVTTLFTHTHTCAWVC